MTDRMNKRQQKALARDLCDSILSSVLTAIEQRDIPPEWDGIELREYIAELADRSRATYMRDKRQPRKREYDNHVTITANL